MSIIIITFANSHELLLLSEIYKSCSTTVPQNSLCQPLECFSCLAVIHCLLLFHLTAPTFFLSPPPLFFFKIQPAAASCICLLAMKRCAINMLVHVMNYSCSPPLANAVYVKFSKCTTEGGLLAGCTDVPPCRLLSKQGCCSP